MTKSKDARIAELEDRLKEQDRRIAELKADLDKATALVAKQNDQVQRGNEILDDWIESCGMTLNDKGEYSWKEEGLEKWYDELADKYGALRARWNKFVPAYRAAVEPTHRSPGRPLKASDAERAKVLALHGKGYSLREIEMEFADISLRTIRTIIDKKDGSDRATMKRLERIAPDKFQEARERRLRRMRKHLPKRINEQIEDADALMKEAKGLR